MDQPFRRKIVLSDDINRALDRVDCFVHRSGFSLRVGRTGEEILDLARRESPNALMTNYFLAGLKGDEVCRALRRGGAAFPILLVGPPSPADVAERCRKSGCDDYIVSPAGPNVLLQRLAAALGIQFRLHTRFPAVISISFGRIVSEFLGYSKDVSEGGILVETNLEIDLGRRLNLRLFLDDRDQPLTARATVLRVDQASDEDQYLLGMQFQSLEPGSAARLKDFIRTRSAP
ncbi:MAG TPA: response regulator [Candidatus Polarisedimenticolia bacterium]|nr:response regulator [Candidatus Polarisedimenticolia bacterium]